MRRRPSTLAALLCALSALPYTATASRSPADAMPVSREVLLMGTRATLTTWDGDAAAGQRRLERLLQSLERTEAQLSTWRPDSEVSRLNAAAGAGPQPLSQPACRLIAALDTWIRATGGAFDPAVGPLTAAWDVHGAGRIPPPEALAQARRRSGWQRLSFDAAQCTLALPQGASIDVGGFGKGAALDAAREAVADDPAPWLIDLGGQIAAAGAPPRSRGWSIALARPDRRTTPFLTISIGDGSLSTSGGSERDRHVRGLRVGHILDPRTGSPAPFAGSVTVWHESALLADILSTALYVMGPRAGLAWARAHEVAALFVRRTADGRLEPRASDAFAHRFPGH